MTALENKEIKGITVKLLYAIVVSTAIIVFTVTGVYFGLKEENTVTNIQVDVLKTQVENIQIEQKELRKRIEKLEIK